MINHVSDYYYILPYGHDASTPIDESNSRCHRSKTLPTFARFPSIPNLSSPRVVHVSILYVTPTKRPNHTLENALQGGTPVSVSTRGLPPTESRTPRPRSRADSRAVSTSTTAASIPATVRPTELLEKRQGTAA